ncbi:MAG TPA: guanylate kinase [Steroidobacteraceae bacterium]|nr:guanylate kinase [Steroidobacteraceae bacterium]
MTQGSKRRGCLFVIAAPSGAGKTSLVNEVLKRNPALKVSVSHSTRKPRPHEIDGQHYHFVSVEEFDRLKKAGAFLEHAQVFDNFYGTGRAQVDALRNAGHDVILEIDWQGAQQVRKAQPDCISIFILPPSRAELEKRLRDRKTDSEEVIARRLRDSIADMSHYAEFDRVIVNDDWETAVGQLLEILSGRPGYEASRPELKGLIRELLA